jgi:hypothetical protein
MIQALSALFRNFWGLARLLDQQPRQGREGELT